MEVFIASTAALTSPSRVNIKLAGPSCATSLVGETLVVEGTSGRAIAFFLRSVHLLEFLGLGCQSLSVSLVFQRGQCRYFSELTFPLGGIESQRSI
jgi:hypothetical protein